MRMSQEIIIDDCWNKTGSWGDGQTRCSRLDFFGHCFNCDVYSGVGRKLLDRESPAGYIEEWTALVANVTQKADGEISSLLLFSIWGNYFSLPTHLLVRVTEYQPLHSIPHSRNKSVMGVANIVGELVVVVSLLPVLKAANYLTVDEGVRFKRVIVIKVGHHQWALPVNEVFGIHKLNVNESRIVVQGMQSECVDTKFTWEDKIVHHINHQKLEKMFEEIRF